MSALTAPKVQRQMREDRLTAGMSLAEERVSRFMDANYPCECSYVDCPGNSFEASEIVIMVVAALKDA